MAKILSDAAGLQATNTIPKWDRLIRKFNTWPILADSLANTV
jgi:hypothetical protein